jgi:propanediol dehydratase small subunit
MTKLTDRAGYPLMENAADSVCAGSGRPLSQITPDAAIAGELHPEDFAISAATLRAQAEIARTHGYVQLAANLSRAAELTAVPNAALLQMYELLRPRRATYEELQSMARRLEEEFDAPTTAAFVRHAAEAYHARGLLMRAGDSP